MLDVTWYVPLCPHTYVHSPSLLSCMWNFSGSYLRLAFVDSCRRNFSCFHMKINFCSFVTQVIGSDLFSFYFILVSFRKLLNILTKNFLYELYDQNCDGWSASYCFSNHVCEPGVIFYSKSIIRTIQNWILSKVFVFLKHNSGLFCFNLFFYFSVWWHWCHASDLQRSYCHEAKTITTKLSVKLIVTRNLLIVKNFSSV